MRKLHCIIGDNENPDYRKEFTVKVYGKEAYAILNTWEDDNEKDHDRFCDHIQSEYDLPRDWYFEKLEDYGEA